MGYPLPMPTSIWLAGLHYLSFLVLLTLLGMEAGVLFFGRSDRETWTRLGRVDMFFGLAAVAVVVTGILRMFHEKGWDYYWNSPLFVAKFACFCLAALVSLLPTVLFIREGIRPGSLRPEWVPRLRMAMVLEWVFVLPIPFLAAAMARGVGL